MILAITPNPALDLGGVVDRLVPNEKSYVHDETRYPGGNAINAARIIQKFGQPVIASGFLGGSTGDEVEKLLKNEGVQCQFVRVQGNTRVSVTVSERKTHRQTRLSFRGPQIQPQETAILMSYVSKLQQPSLVLVGGSLPPGFSSHHLKTLIQTCGQRSIPTIVDVPGNILSELVSSKPFLIKPNLVEFQGLVGRRVSSVQSIVKEARGLLTNIPCICISSVKKGALFVTPQRVWYGEMPPMQVKSTVGAGDSMVGAISAQIWALMARLNSRGEIQDVLDQGGSLLRYGLAAAAATLVTTGIHLGELSEMNQFYPEIKISLIS